MSEIDATQHLEAELERQWKEYSAKAVEYKAMAEKLESALMAFRAQPNGKEPRIRQELPRVILHAIQHAPDSFTFVDVRRIINRDFPGKLIKDSSLRASYSHVVNVLLRGKCKAIGVSGSGNLKTYQKIAANGHEDKAALATLPSSLITSSGTVPNG